MANIFIKNLDKIQKPNDKEVALWKLNKIKERKPLQLCKDV